MNKLSNELYIKHAKRLQFILNDKSPFAQYVKRNDFAFVLKTQLNILSVLEKKFSKAHIENKFKAEALLKKFNSLTKENFKFDKNFKLDDDADYIDNMNYLVTFCKNIFRVDIDEAISGKKVNVSQPRVQLRSDDEQPANNARFGMNAGMTMGADFMDPRQNPLVFGQASVQLQKEISSGQFYRFKTKPKAIPIIKWIAIALIMLSCLGLILMAICAFLTHGIIVGAQGETDTVPLNTIVDGIFFLLFAGLGIYSCVSFFKTILSKNPNDKFYFAWPLFLILIIGTVMAELFSLTRVFPINFYYVEGTALQEFGKNAWKVCWYINISLTCASIVPIVLGSILNPKVDEGAINRRISQIVDSLSSSSGYGYPKNKDNTKEDSSTSAKK